MLYEIEGDLLESKEKYIVHQCNCVTTSAAFLAYHMFSKFPWSDVYAPREIVDGKSLRDIPGDIIIRGNGKDQRYVIALLGQIYPGFAFPNSKDDLKTRENYFRSGLAKIAKIPNLESVAFPYQIGCGAAGGSWGNYRQMIQDFSNDLEGIAEVFIYELPGE